MKKNRYLLLKVLILTVVFVFFAGCYKDHLDPSQVGRFRPVPTVNVVLDTLGVAEESGPAYSKMEEPRPEDLLAYEGDYVFGSGDVVRISIFELRQENRNYNSELTITESGRISIPDVGVVQASGLTETQLEEEIKQILSPDILINPSVTVSLFRSMSRVYSMLGDGIRQPSRYGIPRYDYRLMDALADAGSPSQLNVSYIYVTRKILDGEGLTELGESAAIDREIQLEPVEATPGRGRTDTDIDELLEIIAPYAGETSITSSDMLTDEELEALAAPEDFDVFGRREAAEPELDDLEDLEAEIAQTVPQEAVKEPQPIYGETVADGSQVEWEFKDGKWVPIRTDGPLEARTTPEPERQNPIEQFGWDEVSGAPRTRLIKIPADKLLGGDPKYNIVIRPGDVINVPLDLVGSYYVMGNFNNQGEIRLPGSPVTLKMAVASAGGLNGLAWPKKCEITRQLSDNKEETVMVDLEKIFKGSQPDFFIKQGDVINIGTHGTSRWLAVLRNAFRATYGFGFIYDRNFGDRHFGIDEPLGLFGE